MLFTMLPSIKKFSVPRQSRQLHFTCIEFDMALSLCETSEQSHCNCNIFLFYILFRLNETKIKHVQISCCGIIFAQTWRVTKKKWKHRKTLKLHELNEFDSIRFEIRWFIVVSIVIVSVFIYALLETTTTRVSSSQSNHMHFYELQNKPFH